MRSSSRALFRALLLATSLGWTGVWAYDGNNSTSRSSNDQTLAAPALGISQTSLDIPPPYTSTTTTPSSSTPPIAYSPAIGHSETSLLIPSATAAPYPAIGQSDTSLDLPTTSRQPHTFKSPVVGHSQTSLDIPLPLPSDSLPPIAYSPGTAHSQTSLQLPPTLTEAPIVATAHSETRLVTPTEHHGDGGLVATISLPPEHGHGVGTPTGVAEHEGGDDGRRPVEEGNPGGIIASLAHEHAQEWNSNAGAPLTTASPQSSTYRFLGTQMVAGASAATVGGTTYSLDAAGTGFYVNGVATTFGGPAATDGVAAAVMSALGGGDGGKEGETSRAGGSSTLATTTSREGTDGGAAESTGVPQQTGNAAALVVPGVGMCAVGMVIVLL